MTVGRGISNVFTLISMQLTVYLLTAFIFLVTNTGKVHGQNNHFVTGYNVDTVSTLHSPPSFCVRLGLVRYTTVLTSQYDIRTVCCVQHALKQNFPYKTIQQTQRQRQREFICSIGVLLLTCPPKIFNQASSPPKILHRHNNRFTSTK